MYYTNSTEASQYKERFKKNDLKKKKDFRDIFGFSRLYFFNLLAQCAFTPYKNPL